MKRFVDKNLGIDRLKTTLTNSRIATQNNALYQTIFNLIERLQDVNVDSSAATSVLQQQIDDGGGGGGGGSIPVASDTVEDLDGVSDPGVSLEYSRGDHKHGIDISLTADHVVMSDGGIPNAQPLNNGAGQFLYTPYVP